MINLYTNHPTGSFTIYPDSGEFVSASAYEMVLTQDLDQSTTTIRQEFLTRYNPGSKGTSIIVMQLLSGSTPSPDGQYTAQMYAGRSGQALWGQTHEKFGSYHQKWSTAGGFEGTLISTDRAYVHGSNRETITTNTDTDQIGVYTTYNS